METIKIAFSAIRNVNKNAGGFMPVISVNGRLSGSTFGQGYDREIALALARDMAREEAERYLGDYSVDISEAR